MNKKEAIEYLKENCRSIISIKKAQEIADAFGLKKVPSRIFTNKNTRGIILNEGEAVGVVELTIAIVCHLGNLGKRAITYSPYCGRGREAEYIVEENIKLMGE